MPEWKYAVLCLGFIGFAGMGLYVLLPKTMNVIGKVVFWLIVAGLGCALLYAGAQAVASMSVPTAIIFGAIIIALAINSRR